MYNRDIKGIPPGKMDNCIDLSVSLEKVTDKKWGAEYICRLILFYMDTFKTRSTTDNKKLSNYINKHADCITELSEDFIECKCQLEFRPLTGLKLGHQFIKISLLLPALKELA